MATVQMSEVIQLVNSEATRLGDFLSGLDEREWSRDSACEGWVIGDVLAHLTGSATTWANSINRAVAGDAAPPEGQSFLASGVRGSETTAQAARASHQELGMQLLENFKTGYQRLGQVLGGLTAEDWDKPCFHRRGPMPVGDFVSLRVQELAVHGWDIRSGLDERAELAEEALPLLVGRVPRWLSNAFRPGLELPTPVRYRIQVSGPVAIHEDILVDGDSFQSAPYGDGQADVTFRCNTSNYILLIYGRLNVERAVAAGRLAIEGPQDQASNFTAWFQGF